MLRGFLPTFGLRGQLSQMLHHGVGIYLSDGAKLVFEFVLILEFVFEFVFEFLLAEQAAGNVAESAQEALSRLVFELVFKFEFVFEFARLKLEFVFEFAYALKLEFVFEFVSGPASFTQLCHGRFSFISRSRFRCATLSL
jgi:hypothetical protein